MRQRIMILDGAMGTMIQQLKLSEEDFRGMINVHVCVRACVRACACVCVYMCMMYTVSVHGMYV